MPDTSKQAHMRLLPLVQITFMKNPQMMPFMSDDQSNLRSNRHRNAIGAACTGIIIIHQTVYQRQGGLPDDPVMRNHLLQREAVERPGSRIIILFIARQRRLFSLAKQSKR